MIMDFLLSLISFPSFRFPGLFGGGKRTVSVKRHRRNGRTVRRHSREIRCIDTADLQRRAAWDEYLAEDKRKWEQHNEELDELSSCSRNYKDWAIFKSGRREGDK